MMFYNLFDFPVVDPHFEKALAHGGASSVEQTIEAEVIIRVGPGLEDVQCALRCGIQAHVTSSVVELQTVLAMHLLV